MIDSPEPQLPATLGHQRPAGKKEVIERARLVLVQQLATTIVALETFGRSGVASPPRPSTLALMETLLPWIVALASLVILAAVLIAGRMARRQAPQPQPLPSEWALAPRPVFSTDERRVYRQLREALPHHIVLSKLPLVRFLPAG